MTHIVSLIKQDYPQIDFNIDIVQPDTQLTALLPKDIGKAWLTASLQSYDTAIALWCGVACGQRLLPVPITQEHIQLVLKRLEGRQHQIIMMLGRKTNDKIHIKTSVSRAKFKCLSHQERQSLLANQSLWQNKLGGYIGESQQRCFIQALNGDPGALFGYSCYMLHHQLQALG